MSEFTDYVFAVRAQEASGQGPTGASTSSQQGGMTDAERKEIADKVFANIRSIIMGGGRSRQTSAPSAQTQGANAAPVNNNAGEIAFGGSSAGSKPWTISAPFEKKQEQNVLDIINGGASPAADNAAPAADNASQVLDQTRAAYDKAKNDYETAKGKLNLTMSNHPGGSDYIRAVEEARSEAHAALSRLNEAKSAYEQAGGQVDPSFRERVWDTITGGLKGSGASNVDAQRALYEAGQGFRDRQTQENIDELQAKLDESRRNYSRYEEAAKTATGRDLELYREGMENEQYRIASYEQQLAAFGKVGAAQRGATEETSALADALQASSASDIARAKQGASAFGGALVDVGAAATQMAGDTAAGFLAGGNMLPALALRSFGSGTQEARQEGANIGQQLAYGGLSAAVEVLTEQMADGLAGIAGKGAADDLAEEVIGRLAKTDAGRTALRAAYSMGGEAAEELVSSFVNPAIKSVYDNGAAAKESYLTPEGRKQLLVDSAYDAFIGAFLGGTGAVASIATGQNAAKNRELSRAQAAQAQTSGVPVLDMIRTGEVQGDTTVPAASAAPAAPAASAGNPVLDLIRTGEAQSESAPAVETAAQTPDSRLAEVESRLDEINRELDNSSDLDDARIMELTTEGQQLWEEQQRLQNQIQARNTQQERVNAGEVSKGFGTAENHIDNRTNADVSKPGVKAFQFDHPELHPHFVEAAQVLMEEVQAADMQTAVRAGQKGSAVKRGPVRTLMDLGLSKPEIMKCLNDIIQNNGQENYAAAKRVELVLNDMMSNGWTGNGGQAHDANADYIAAKDAIDGGVKADSWEKYLADHGTVLALGEVTEDELRAEWEAMHPEEAAQPVAETQPAPAETNREFSTEERQALVEKAIEKDQYARRLFREAKEATNKLDFERARQLEETARKYQKEAKAIRDQLEGRTGQESAPATQPVQPESTPAPAAQSAAQPAPLVNGETGQNAATAETTNGSGPERERGGSANIRTNENAEPDLRQSFEANPALYRQLTNAEVKAKADAILAKGFDAARGEVEQAVGQAKAGKKLAPEHLVAGFEVANELTRRGDVDAANRLMADIFAEQTAAGQLGQLGRFLRQNSPAVKSMTVQNIVDKMNNALTEGQLRKNMRRGVGDAEGRISVDPALVEQFANATTDADADAAMDAIMDSVASQVPATFVDKFTALRYLNMLGNIKTQGRNIVGNTAMMLATDAKRAVQAVAELAASAATGGRYERNTSLFTSPELRRQARADFEQNLDYIKGEGKYSEAGRKALQGIQDRRRIFDSKVLEGARNLTNWAMDAGDVIFMKHTYTQAFAGWMKAHGIEDVSNATQDQLARAREFAAKEAQEATFHDSNKVSDFVSKIGRGDNTPGVVNALAEGVLPFRKTPANVAVRAVEYSPLGIAKAISDAYQIKSGAKTGADVINDLSKTATGTSLAVAGYLLAAAGKARGSGDDSDKDLNYFQKMRGASDYSVKIGDSYVSLSQFAPMAIPFFMGVKLNELMENNEEPFSLDSIGDILGIISDPMLEMSMLSGVNDTLNNIASLNGDTDAIPSLVTNAALGYLTQGLSNTLIGQFEQAREENRQTVYSDTKSADASVLDQMIGAKGQKQLGRFSSKIPGWDYNQQDYVDAWGRTQSTGGGLERYFNALINPTYSSGDRSTRVDNELERLHRDNRNVEGFPSVLPEKRGRNQPIGDGVVMTPDEYLQFSKDSGQMKLDLVSDFMDSTQYQQLNDRQRAEIISNLYAFADDRALARVKSNYGIETQSTYDKLLSGLYEANGDEKRPPLEEKNIGEFIAFDTARKSAENNGDFDALSSLFNGFNKLNENTQAVLAARDPYARLVLGTDKPGTSSDIPPLDLKNVAEYARFETGIKDATASRDYNAIDDLLSRYAGLDENTKTVLEKKNPGSMKGVLAFLDAGSGSESYYKLKDAIGDAQWDMDSAGVNAHVKLAGLADADIPDAEKDQLVDSGAFSLSATSRSAYDILRGQGMSPGDISKWFTNADWYASGPDKEAKADGKLNAYEVAVAISKIPDLSESERSSLYLQFKSALQNPKDAYDTWKRRTYKQALGQSWNYGRTVGRSG